MWINDWVVLNADILWAADIPHNPGYPPFSAYRPEGVAIAHGITRHGQELG